MKNLKSNNNKVNSNKTIHVEPEKKVNDLITSYKELINDISVKVEIISTKWSTKDFNKWI